jgi:hypothetical protein
MGDAVPKAAAGCRRGEDVRAEDRSLAVAHVAIIREKIADFQAMERVLTEATIVNVTPGSAHGVHTDRGSFIRERPE